MVNVAKKPNTPDDSRNQPDLYPSMYTAVIVLMVMSVSTATVDRNAASQELSALYNDNGAHVGTDLDARPQGHRVGC